MVKENGIPLIDCMLHQIDEKQFFRIIIVNCFKGQELVDYIGPLNIRTPIVYINNPVYYKRYSGYW